MLLWRSALLLHARVSAPAPARPRAPVDPARRSRLGRFRQDKPHPRDKGASDAFVIASAVVVHPADTLVETADQSRDLGIDVDVGALGQQPQARKSVV